MKAVLRRFFLCSGPASGLEQVCDASTKATLANVPHFSHFNVTAHPTAEWTAQQIVLELPQVGGLHHRYERRAA